jgi:hypothetical protein
VAFETKVWNVDAAARRPSAASSVELDPFEALHYFVTTEAQLRYWMTVVDRRGGVQVDYEELTTSWHETMAQIFRQLRWSPASVDPRLQKRITDELPTLIANYTELQRFFAQSPWEPFFP